MKKLLEVICVLVLVMATQIQAKEFIEQAPVYGVIKPKVITTLLAVNHGMVSVIPKGIGDRVRPGTTILKVIEKETTRQYRSSIHGRVAKAHVTSGAAVTPGMPLVTVLDPNRKLIEVSLSPSEASKIKLGSTVRKRGESAVFGKIEKISPLVDPDTGGVVAYISTDKPVKRLIGDVLALTIDLRSIDGCKVVEISEVNKYTNEYVVEATTGSKACLKTAVKE